MVVTIQQVERGVCNYIEEEIAKKSTGALKFGVYFMLPTIQKKMRTLIQQFQTNELTKDFFGDNGNLNLDMVYNNAKSAIQKSGQIEMYGVILNESDVDKLYNYIRETSI